VDGEREKEEIEKESGENVKGRAEAENVAYVIFTSGSTGRPKGVLVEHRNLLNTLMASREKFDLRPTDVMPVIAQVSFDISLFELLLPLVSGASALLISRPRILDLSQLLSNLERATMLHALPSLMRQIVNHLEEQGETGRLHKLRKVFVGGDAVTGDLLEQMQAVFPEAELHVLYGPTETTIICTSYQVENGSAHGWQIIGTPLPNMKIRICDADGNLAPVGVRGELYIGGAGVSRGYLNLAELTAEKFLKVDGLTYYRSGDVGRYLPDGKIEFLGRVDQQVKIRGYRIEPGEIEASLNSHPSVRESVVVVEDEGAERRLVAYLAYKTGAERCGPKELRAYLRERLPDYMVPRSIVCLEQLPLTTNGKVDRKALRAYEPTQPARDEELLAPRTPAEQALAHIWQEVLGVGSIGVDENFFELGGDSILSLQIVARANRIGLRLTPKLLFKHQTIAELAEAAGSVEKTEVEQDTPTGFVPLSPVQRRFFAENLNVPEHFNQSLILEVRRALEPGTLRTALRHLMSHHDALRMRFVKDEQQEWRQFYSAPEEAVPLTVVSLSGLDEAERRRIVEETAAETQRNLNLSEGPLLRVVYFDSGKGLHARLLIVIHHLIMDGVSWRILLEDLGQAIEQAESDDPIALPAKTSSFKQWATALREMVEQDEARRHLSYWEGERWQLAGRLPVDREPSANSFATEQSVEVSLTMEETRRLLQDVPRAYRTQINDALLTALARALCRWADSSSIILTIEGHGREELRTGLDTTRTIGWFTTLYPALLELDTEMGAGETLKRVKEQLRDAARDGRWYGAWRYLSQEPEIKERLAGLGPSEVVFNYLGQLDQALNSEGIFGRAPESTGPMQDVGEKRPHLLEVNGSVSDARLQVSWRYSSAVHERATIEKVAARFIEELRELIEHCTVSEACGYTPSDFPLAQLGQQELDLIVQAEQERAKGLPAEVARTEIEDLYVLSPMQQGMLFHSLFEPEGGVYVNLLSWRVEGRFEAEAFARSWQSVVERHAILRTGFLWERLEHPVQVVRRGVRVQIHEEDWRGLDESLQAERLQAYKRAEQARGFDLTAAPLMRLAVMQVSDAAWQVVWTHHHLLTDGWCLSLVLREVFDAYEAQAAGGRRVSREKSPSYRDYIEWLQKQDLGAAREYWTGRLAGFGSPTPLPAGGLAASSAPPPRDGRVEDDERYREERRRLDERETKRLQTFARERQLTLNTLVQGAWALLLYRYSGEDDVLFGATVSGRPAELPRVEEMIGLFINTLPVRVRVRAGLSVVEWLRQLQHEQVEMRQYEYSPLVQVQEWSGMQRGVPMFETLVVFENFPVDGSLKEQAGRNDHLKILEVGTVEHTNYPLTVVAVPGERFELRFNYDSQRFDKETMARMLRHLENLLESIVAAPESAVGELSMLSADERSSLLVGWNDTARELPPQSCLHQLFEAQAKRTPDATAVIFEDRQLSYRELNERANQLARYLRRMGVGAEVLVGLSVDRSMEMVVGLLGILKAGGAFVPLDPQYPLNRLSFMLDDAGLKLLLTQQHLLEALPEHGAEVVCLDRDWGRICAGAREDLEGAATEDNAAYVIYTSGSTGAPKGVVVQHRSACNLAAAQIADFRLNDCSRLLQFASLNFDAAVSEIFTALLSGATLCLASTPQLMPGPALLDLLNRHAISTVTLPPTALRALPSASLPDLRTLVVAGEQCDRTTLLDWSATGRQLINAYGPTEGTVCATMWVADAEQLSWRKPPIGHPISNVRVYILDERLEPVPIGALGQLYLGGEGVSRGYLRRARLTAERFIPDPFSSQGGERLYATGDLGRYLPDGEIEYVGRSDEQVKVRGYRIELGEIEAVLSEHQRVRECAVVVKEDEESGEQKLVCYLVSGETKERDAASEEETGGLTAGELRAWLGARLPDYMLPGEYLKVRELPLTENGKLDRRKIREMEGERAESGSEYQAARSAIEEMLVGVWSDVLGVENLSVHDNFFDLGGHSLRATQLISRIRQLFNLEMPLRILFEHPRISSLALWLEEALREAQGLRAPAIVPTDRRAPLPLSFAQQRLWFMDQLEPGSAFYNIPAAMRLSGRLNVAALERTLLEIVRRHEVLRTSFVSEGGTPVQIVGEAPSTGLPLADLSALPPELREQEAERLVREETERGFDLGRGPLLRACLLKLGAEEHVLLLNMHHIVSDGWSMGVLVEEVSKLYSAYSRGEEPLLEELEIQYGDFAVWQREWLQGEALERQLSYWRKRLGGALPVLQLPADRPRPQTHSWRGAHRSFQLPQPLSEQLKELSRAHGVTLYMTLLAAFKVLLWRYTGQDDILIGSVIAGRNRRETEALIGFFLNTLVMRTDLSGKPTFIELLGRVREVCLGAYAHQDVPFEKLVEELQPERGLSASPVVQATFGLQNAPMGELTLPELKLSRVEFESEVARLDLTLWLMETSEGLAGNWTYSTELFDEARIERMESHFQRLLESIVAEPGARINRLEIMTESEKADQLVEEREYEKDSLQSLMRARRKSVTLLQ
jgi:amino acid adenylation domain-containing protein/non-ribosomal peptide synthase protein (TIGR01720 family)